MIHPDTELRFINAEVGFGVVATRFIARGTITWVQDELDQVFPSAYLESVAPLLRGNLVKYSFVNGRGEYVLCWDLGRYVNHSCDPACLSAGYNFEIAVRDIHPGDEVTDDYAALNLEGTFECRCQTPECRSVIRDTDVYTHADRWDGIVRAAFPRLSAVPQPLWPLVAEQEAVSAALAGLDPIPSCKRNLRGYQDRLARP